METPEFRCPMTPMTLESDANWFATLTPVFGSPWSSPENATNVRPPFLAAAEAFTSVMASLAPFSMPLPSATAPAVSGAPMASLTVAVLLAPVVVLDVPPLHAVTVIARITMTATSATYFLAWPMLIPCSVTRHVLFEPVCTILTRSLDTPALRDSRSVSDREYGPQGISTMGAEACIGSARKLDIVPLPTRNSMAYVA